MGGKERPTVNTAKLSGVSKCHLSQQDTHVAALAGYLYLVPLRVGSCSEVRGGHQLLIGSFLPSLKGSLTSYWLAHAQCCHSRREGLLLIGPAASIFLRTSKCSNARNKYVFVSAFARGHKVTSAFLTQFLNNRSVPCVCFSLFIFQGKIITNGILRKFLLHILRIQVQDMAQNWKEDSFCV